MDTANIIYMLLLLVLVGGAVFRRGNAGKNTQHAITWGLIILALVLGYRVYERFNAQPRQINGDIALSIPFSRFHQGYVTYANVNGVEGQFLFDTGASHSVLTYELAEDAGINLAALRFDQEISTANGTTFYANTTIDQIAFGEQIYRNLPVLIAPEDNLDISLIGMNLMRQFTGFYVGDNKLLIEF